MGLSDEGANVTTPDIGADDDAAFTVLAADLVRARCNLQGGKGGQRHKTQLAVAAAWQRNRQAADGIHVVAYFFRQAHLNVKALVAFEHGAGFAPAQSGADGVLHVAHVEAVARGFFAINLYREHGQAGGLLDLDFRSARNVLQHAGHGLRCGVEHLHVVTKNLDGYIAAHA